jgi:hypothetical protein
MVFPGERTECLQGATVEVIIDGTVVQRATQNEPCTYWDDGGVWFSNLPLAEVTLRASAPAYITQEKTATPTTGWITALPIGLKPAN